MGGALWDLLTGFCHVRRTAGLRFLSFIPLSLNSFCSLFLQLVFYHPFILKLAFFSLD